MPSAETPPPVAKRFPARIETTLRPVSPFIRLRTRADRETAQAILALMREPPPKPTERSLTGLAREVRAEFVEAQRMGSWGRR